MSQGSKHHGGHHEGNKPEYRPRVEFVVEKKNKKFETYYKVGCLNVREVIGSDFFTLQAQQILPESEWEAFMESLREGLPTAFRLTGNRTYVMDTYRQCSVDRMVY